MEPCFIQNIGFEAAGVSINTKKDIHSLHTVNHILP